MDDGDAYLESLGAAVNRKLEAVLSPADTTPAILHEAMRYSVCAGGKRIRPILCLACCEVCGAPADQALHAAAALELVHAYSLIHDDLPAMDDDDLRRGHPTAHIQFGEANAILAGDALLTLAFEVMASLPAPPPHPPGENVVVLARAAGRRGMVAGQVADMAAESRVVTQADVAYIHLHKTADLISAACLTGAVCAGAEPDRVTAMATYGRHLGLAFQQVDDLLNITATADQLGKTAGSDQARNKATYPALLGIEEARRMAAAETAKAQDALEGEWPGDVDPLMDFADSLLHRMA